MHHVTVATQHAYDTNAAGYADATRDFGTFPGLLEELERFDAQVSPGGLILDLGCGAGRDSDHLLERGRTVVAADVSRQMLLRTRTRCDPAVFLVQLDLAWLPFRDGTFAGVWACASLVHVHSDQLATALHELFRVLQVDAPIAISMKSGADEGWSAGKSMPDQRWFNLMLPDVFAKVLSDNGFRDVRTTQCGRPGWYVAIGQKSGQL